MSSIGASGCFHHHARTAVARCPVCRRSFCRECITEHDGRVICAGCLEQRSGVAEKPKRRFRFPWYLVGCAAGGLVAWLFFYYLGSTLLEFPSEFHDREFLKEMSGEGN